MPVNNVIKESPVIYSPPGPLSPTERGERPQGYIIIKFLKTLFPRSGERVAPR